MNILSAVNAMVITVGIPVLIKFFIDMGKQLKILETIDAAVTKIKHNMKVVGDYLTRSHAKFNPNDLQAFSPIQLTNDGHRLIAEMGFDNVFEKNKTDFFSFIDSEHPLLKYDVEVAAAKAIYALCEKPYMQFLKVFFYNNPDRNMDNTALTLGVYMRDRYLSAHPEITQ